MFESPNVKKDNEKLVDMGRRKILGALGAATVAGVGSALFREGEGESVNGTVPEISEGNGEADSDTVFKSSKPEIMGKIIQNIEEGDHETYIAAIEYLSSLNAEKALLLKSVTSITDLLLDMDGTSKKEAFFLMEHNRLQQKIASTDEEIAEFQEILQKSPFYGTDVTVTPRNESLLKEPFKSSNNTSRPTSI